VELARTVLLQLLCKRSFPAAGQDSPEGQGLTGAVLGQHMLNAAFLPRPVGFERDVRLREKLRVN
jgi:hypothetical protein